MTQYVIRVENNTTLNFPIVWENFIQVFPNADYNNLPLGYMQVNKAEIPELRSFEVCEDTHYLIENNVVNEIYTVREMTEQEKQAKIEKVYNLPHPESWVFDPTLPCWIPPTTLCT
jgi:hypothetical protein